jgi:hypothetical protein
MQISFLDVGCFFCLSGEYQIDTLRLLMNIIQLKSMQEESTQKHNLLEGKFQKGVKATPNDNQQCID